MIGPSIGLRPLGDPGGGGRFENAGWENWRKQGGVASRGTLSMPANVNGGLKKD